MSNNTSHDFAIIAAGGKQYKVSAGQKVKIEKTGAEEGGTVAFEGVLLRSVGGVVTIGAPYISGATVQATVARNGRERKKIIFKYHSKTRQRKKKGHRQMFTEVEIVRI